MACGRLSYSIVRALTRVATPDNEARLVAVACGATAAQVERLVRGWRQADREAQPDAEQVRLARRTLSTRVDEDGMVVLRARLTPEIGAVVLRALEAALEQVPVAADDEFLRPNGEPLPAVPAAPRREGVGPPLAPTVERLAAAGISIGPHTATPEWYGESLNVAAAIDVLWEPPVASARGSAP